MGAFWRQTIVEKDISALVRVLWRKDPNCFAGAVGWVGGNRRNVKYILEAELAQLRRQRRPGHESYVNLSVGGIRGVRDGRWGRELAG